MLLMLAVVGLYTITSLNDKYAGGESYILHSLFMR